MINSDVNTWTGIYKIRAVYKYQKEVEAQLAIELVQTDKEIKGKGLFQKQAIWKEDMHGVFEGLLDDVGSKKVKLNLKWYNTEQKFLNQSDLIISMNDDYSSFEGLIKNMMYSGIYYGTKVIDKKSNGSVIPTPNTPTKNTPQIIVSNPNNSSNNNLVEVNGQNKWTSSIRMPGRQRTTGNNRSSNNISVSPNRIAENNENMPKSGRDSSQNKIQDSEYSQEAAMRCIVCLERPKMSVFVPCGHKCTCEECAIKFVDKHKCPLCKKSVESIIKKVFE